MTGWDDGPPGSSGPPPAVDQRAELMHAVGALARTDAGPTGRGSTSDLTVDEVLLLHAAGFEPVELVCGVAVVSVPRGAWSWGQGMIGSATEAHGQAFSAAAARLRRECVAVDGIGVVGVRVEVTVQPQHVDVALTGSAIRARGTTRRATPSGDPFLSDLSARDFTLLVASGWAPVGLAFGATFVFAPRRSAGAALRQSSQNVELTNFTEAMYAAREGAMELMQHSALAMGAQGIVAVQVQEGPMRFASHAVGFVAWGTSVRLVAEAHRYLQPQVVLPLDDAVVQFEAGSLRR